MIERLTGILLEKQPPVVLIDVHGVGYGVAASMQTFYQLGQTGEKITLHIHFVVRDDAQLLYGFADKQERSLFRALIKVNGVGPKLALTILSSVTTVEFTQFVLDHNSAALMRLPGIGKKTAERLIVEMRDRLKNADNLSLDIHSLSPGAATLKAAPDHEAISALMTLGYKPAEASRAIARINVENLSSEEIIRLALQGMVAKN